MTDENCSNPDKMFSGNLEGEHPRVKIIGVGGAGNNAVDRLKLDNLIAVDMAVVNTDGQVLNASPIEEKVMIGRSVTRGLGSGGDSVKGREAAVADSDALSKLVQGVDMVFILAGLGGGTGSGAAPVMAEAAANTGALVIAFVTMPFTIEGAERHRQAEDSLNALREVCHAAIPLPNDILLQQIDEDATVLEAFALADEWISRGVRAILSMLQSTGLINVDFGTLRKAFQNRSAKTLFGLGRGEGEDFVRKGIDDLMLCPLLHTPEYSKRADRLVINISGGPDLTMTKVKEIVTMVVDKFGSRDDTVIGAVIDGGLKNSIEICVIGTTHIEGRNLYRKGKPEKVVKPAQTASEMALLDEDGRPRAVHTSKLKDRKQPDKPQEEFTFTKAEEQRGYFEKTERNLFDGEDLDVPTYLRRGIKIQL